MYIYQIQYSVIRASLSATYFFIFSYFHCYVTFTLRLVYFRSSVASVISGLHMENKPLVS